MYDLPSMNDVAKVIIDEAVIKGKSQPLIVYKNAEQLAVSA